MAKNKRVLIVDDDTTMQAIFSALLTCYKVDIDVAVDGQECLSSIKSKPDYDFIILDILMPNVDGIEVVRRISSTGFKGQICLISGANADYMEAAERLAEAFELNVIGRISKPASAEDLTKVFGVAGLCERQPSVAGSPSHVTVN